MHYQMKNFQQKKKHKRFAENEAMNSKYHLLRKMKGWDQLKRRQPKWLNESNLTLLHIWYNQFQVILRVSGLRLRECILIVLHLFAIYFRWISEVYLSWNCPSIYNWSNIMFSNFIHNYLSDTLTQTFQGNFFYNIRE